MKRIAAGIIAILLTTTIVLGTSTAKSIDATYRNIKVIVDGKEVTMKDANGNSIEPFIVDGTTYLPVRAVSEALGREVSWVESINSIIIGSPPSAGGDGDSANRPEPAPAVTANPPEEQAQSAEPTPEPEQDEIYGFGEVFYFDNFEIKIDNQIVWTTTAIDDQDDKENVISRTQQTDTKYRDNTIARIPVSVRNVDNVSNILPADKAAIYSPQGDIADYVPQEFTDDLFKFGTFKAGEHANLYLHLLYSEAGEYTIEFKKDNDKKTVRLFIKKPAV